MPPLTKEELSTFLPHTGAMRLIDLVDSWDATTIRCRTRSHRDVASPLRQGGRLDAVTGLEYAAQAMGVHVGLLNRERSTEGLIGYVGGVKDVVLSVDRLDDCPGELTIEASHLFDSGESFMYQFAISSGGHNMMTGRASIFIKREPS